MLKGPTALAWSNDAVSVAKTAVEFARTNEKFVLVGGALGTQTLNADGVKALAELPSLDVLRAGIVGMISTPATRIAGVMQGVAGQLARVFGAFARKDEASAEAA
jgi:large subunit ribosomal protein L10